MVSSNLCTEIVQYSSHMDTAVCTLASISLPRFVRDRNRFDFDAFHDVVKLAVRNTDRLLDCAIYPTAESACTVNTTRAIGVGVQGLADVFMAMKLPYDSQDARELNILIFETLYHASLDASCSVAQIHGPYPSWAGSPASTGNLYIDMWPAMPARQHDFQALRERVTQYGLRNSVITAQMPTASTSYLLGNTPGVEPIARRVFPHPASSLADRVFTATSLPTS